MSVISRKLKKGRTSKFNNFYLNRDDKKCKKKFNCDLTKIFQPLYVKMKANEDTERTAYLCYTAKKKLKKQLLGNRITEHQFGMNQRNFCTS